MSYAPHSRTQSIDQRLDTGPFDIIGDVHGCTDELEVLLRALAYAPDAHGVWQSSQGRTAVFVGDLVDRGPRIVDAVRLVMAMVAAGRAYCVPGNHDAQLHAHLSGVAVPIVYGLDVTLAQLEPEPPPAREQIRVFFETLMSHYIFDDGRLVVAHTGLPEALQGVDTPEVRRLAAYGMVGDEVDPGDVAMRHPWIETYAGKAAVVFGHTRVLQPVWRNNAIDIDTGCVYGWRLTALQWPEKRLVSVPAHRIHTPTKRPFLPTREAAAGS